MGEAKRRGSKEDRIKEAHERDQLDLGKMAETLARPVDEELFLFCMQVYMAAAKMTMPVENPENRKVDIEGFGEIAFTDNSTNRGMMAVSNELADQGVDEATRIAVTFRVTQLGDLFRAKDRLSKWIRPADASGEVEISDALLRACASAKINFTPDRAGFDLEDLDRIATEIDARLEAEEAAKKPDQPGPAA